MEINEWTISTEHGSLTGYENPFIQFNKGRPALLGKINCSAAHLPQLLSTTIRDAQNKGFDYILGPMNGSTWNDYRIVTQGDAMLFPGEPTYPFDLNKVFSESGFEPVAHYVSQEDSWLYVDEETHQSLGRLIAERKVSIRGIRLNDLEKELLRIAEFCNIAFAGNFLFSPTSPHSFVEKYMPISSLMDSDLILIAEKDEKMLGFVFGFRDPGMPRRVILKTLARLPVKDAKGLGKYLSDQLTINAKQKGVSSVIHALMLDSNNSVSISDQHKPSIIRRYALYGRAL